MESFESGLSGGEFESASLQSGSRSPTRVTINRDGTVDIEMENEDWEDGTQYEVSEFVGAHELEESDLAGIQQSVERLRLQRQAVEALKRDLDIRDALVHSQKVLIMDLEAQLKNKKFDKKRVRALEKERDEFRAEKEVALGATAAAIERLKEEQAETKRLEKEAVVERRKWVAERQALELEKVELQGRVDKVDLENRRLVLANDRCKEEKMYEERARGEVELSLRECQQDFQKHTKNLTAKMDALMSLVAKQKQVLAKKDAEIERLMMERREVEDVKREVELVKRKESEMENELRTKTKNLLETKEELQGLAVKAEVLQENVDDLMEQRREVAGQLQNVSDKTANLQAQLAKEVAANTNLKKLLNAERKSRGEKARQRLTLLKQFCHEEDQLHTLLKSGVGNKKSLLESPKNAHSFTP